MRESIVIGIVGENCAGKDSFARFFKDVVPPVWSVEMIRFFDPISETARSFGIEKNRHNMQRIPVVLEQEFGKGLLANEIARRVEESDKDIVIANGLRWPQDLEMLRVFPKNILVYITATPETRYNRMRARKEKAGECMASWEQFLREGAAPNEITIPVIGGHADWKFENEGTTDDLLLNVKEFFSEKIYHLMDITLRECWKN